MGLLISVVLLACALIMKRTNGLFLSRTISQFKIDRNDPKYEQERKIGKAFTFYILRYVPPIFIGFLILFILKMMNLI